MWAFTKNAVGKPRVSTMPYLYDIGEGNVSGHTPWSKIGFNGDVDNVEEDMIVQGGTYVFPVTQLTMSIVSTSALDATGSAGATQVTVYYLDDTYTEKSVMVSMNGTTAVQVAPDVFRVQNARVSTMGNSVTTTNGTIAIYSGSVTYGYLSVGRTRMRQCIWTVPKGKKLFITSVVVGGANVAANHYARFTTKANYDEKAGTVLQAGLFLPYHEILLVDSSFERTLEIPTGFPTGVDLKVTAISDASNANEVCSCALRGWLE